MPSPLSRKKTQNKTEDSSDSGVDTLVGKIKLTHKFIMPAASHTTCAIRSVKRVQMGGLAYGWCVLTELHHYLIPPAVPSDCSLRPACVTHTYSVTPRLT